MPEENERSTCLKISIYVLIPFLVHMSGMTLQYIENM